MVKQNLHCHTTFDDGINTPEEMVLAAIDAGLTSLGISAHTPIDGEDWCMPSEKEAGFLAEMQRLKEKYSGRFDIFSGVEYDLAVPQRFDGYEYVIASGHILDGFYVDATRDGAIALINHFGGPENAAEAFFANYARIADVQKADIVGHFDLLTKYEEQGALYDQGSAYFRDAAFAAMEKLNKAGKIFEINTGAISRGYRSSPYPSRELLKHLKSIGGRICISSDAHSADGIVCAFDIAEALAVSCGFDEVWQLTSSGFLPEKL